MDKLTKANVRVLFLEKGVIRTEQTRRQMFPVTEEAGVRNNQLIPSIYTRHSAVHISDSILKKERCVLSAPFY